MEKNNQSRIKRVLKITRQNGFRFALRMLQMKLDRIDAIMLAPITIFLSNLISFGKPQEKSVLIVMEDKRSASAVNRAYNLRTYLQISGYKVTLTSTSMSCFQLFVLKRYSVIVMQRTINLQIILEILKRAKSSTIPVVYDCDDLIFSHEYVDKIKDDLNTNIEWWRKKALKYNNVFVQCDYFLTSTDFLADIASKLGKKSFVLRNGLDENFDKSGQDFHLFSKQFDRINSKDENPTDQWPFENTIVIGYQSGTSTHNHDFELIASPILKIMNENSHVYFEVIGFLDLPNEFNTPEISDRIIRTSFVSFDKLPNRIKSFNINVAPSQVDNAFSEGKSELKYVYAGAMGVPTVASPTSAYKFGIIDNVNGFLAKNEEEWYEKIKLLVDDEALRREVGEKAFMHIMTSYAPLPLSDDAKSIFDEILSKK